VYTAATCLPLRFLALAISATLFAAGCGSSETGPQSLAPPGDAGSDRSSTPDPYVIQVFDTVRIGSDPSQPNFQRANTQIDLRGAPFERVRLVVDLSTTCFPFDSWQTNRPPAGQNWPADCDAFDRNFELSLDNPMSPDAGQPGIELVRAITPFGGPMQLDVDITDVANGRPGKQELTAYIATYTDSEGQVSGSNGGWNVSARLEVAPGPAPRTVLAVIPLFYGAVGVPESEPASFETPAGTARSRLEYRATGHGGVAFGCGVQTAEEFCPRTHTLLADGAVIADILPWRDDCATLCTLAHYGPDASGFDYCVENPCGAPASVRASRANWCPGSISPPFAWELDALSVPGIHEFRWQISEVAEGGTWQLSALFFAFAN
jgi:hypothetical protein